MSDHSRLVPNIGQLMRAQAEAPEAFPGGSDPEKNLKANLQKGKLGCCLLLHIATREVPTLTVDNMPTASAICTVDLSVVTEGPVLYLVELCMKIAKAQKGGGCVYARPAVPRRELAEVLRQVSDEGSEQRAVLLRTYARLLLANLISQDCNGDPLPIIQPGLMLEALAAQSRDHKNPWIDSAAMILGTLCTVFGVERLLVMTEWY